MKTVFAVFTLVHVLLSWQLRPAIGSGTVFTASDTLFLLDASLTIDKDRFYNELLDFTNRYVSQAPPESQVGLITFNKEITEQIPFGNYTPEAWADAVEVIREERTICCSLGTPIAEALEKAAELLKSKGANEKQAVMMFTDGEPYQIETGKYRTLNTRTNEEEYLFEVVPGAAQRLKDDGVRLIVYAIPGIRITDGSQTTPDANYFSGLDTIIGAEGRTKVCLNLTRAVGKRSCFVSELFPVVSEPIERNLFAVNDWADFFNLTTLNCDTLDACPPTSSPTGSTPTVPPPTFSPTTSAPTAVNETLAPTTVESRGGVSCFDGLMNGNETGNDCGGGTCIGCGSGDRCNTDTDCLDGLVCLQRSGSFSICAEPNCTDSAMNAKETDVDCGGPECQGCNIGQSCNTTSDCLSGLECIDEVCSSTQGGGNTASIIGVIATVVVLCGYAIVSLLTGAVTAGNAANYMAVQGTTAFTEISSVFTLYEFLSLAQYTTLGSTMNLPFVPENYRAFSTSMGFTLLNFIPVGPSPTTSTDDKAGRRLQSVDADPDAVATYAAQWNLQPQYLLPSVFIGFVITFFVIIILYLISRKLKVVVAEHVLKRKLVKKPQPLTGGKMLQVVKEAMIRLLYYLAFPIAFVFTYHFRLASLETSENQQNGVTIGFTVVAALLVPLILMTYVIGFQRTKDYPRVEVNMIQEGSKRNLAEIKETGENTVTKQLGRKVIYRCLAADWKYECRLFWAIRVVFNVLRGIIVGVLVTGEPRPAQGIIFLVVACLYCLTLMYYQPYETYLQNLTGLFIAVAYIPSTVLLLLFSMEPRPYLQQNEFALGVLAIVLQLLVLLGMLFLVLCNYLRSFNDWVARKRAKQLEEKRQKEMQKPESPRNVEKVVLDEPGDVKDKVVDA